MELRELHGKCIRTPAHFHHPSPFTAPPRLCLTPPLHCRQASAATSATVASGAAAAPEPPPPLNAESQKALESALTDLFADHPVVTMRDVRVWLQSYTANAKARVAALQTDKTLSDLLCGGGSVVQIRCGPLRPRRDHA